jgi:hypothetical protein
MHAANLWNLVLRHITGAAVCAVVLTPAAAGAAPAAASATNEQSGRKSMASSNKPGAVSADELLALFPGALAGWQQTELGKPLPSRLPGPQPAVQAKYTLGEQSARITVSSGLLPAAAKPGAPLVTRQPRADGRDARVTVSLANRVQISATSPSANTDTLEKLLLALDLTRFEALKAAGRK